MSYTISPRVCLVVAIYNLGPVGFLVVLSLVCVWAPQQCSTQGWWLDKQHITIP